MLYAPDKLHRTNSKVLNTKNTIKSVGGCKKWGKKKSTKSLRALGQHHMVVLVLMDLVVDVGAYHIEISACAVTVKSGMCNNEA